MALAVDLHTNLDLPDQTNFLEQSTLWDVSNYKYGTLSTSTAIRFGRLPHSREVTTSLTSTKNQNGPPPARIALHQLSTRLPWTTPALSVNAVLGPILPPYATLC